MRFSKLFAATAVASVATAPVAVALASSLSLRAATVSTIANDQVTGETQAVIAAVVLDSAILGVVALADGDNDNAVSQCHCV